MEKHTPSFIQFGTARLSRHVVASTAYPLAMELFTVALVTYAVGYVLEQVLPGFVSAVLDLNIVLGVTIVSGVLIVAFRERSETKKKSSVRSRKITGIWVALISLAGAFVVWIKTTSLGSMSLPLAILAGLALFFISLVLLDTRDDE